MLLGCTSKKNSKNFKNGSNMKCQYWDRLTKKSTFWQHFIFVEDRMCYLHVGTQAYLLAGVDILVICHKSWNAVCEVNLWMFRPKVSISVHQDVYLEQSFFVTENSWVLTITQKVGVFPLKKRTTSLACMYTIISIYFCFLGEISLRF